MFAKTVASGAPKVERWRAVVLTCIFAALLLICAPPTHAQTGPAPARNSAYLELLGNGGLYSINYDRAVIDSVRLRVGVSGWTAGSWWGGEDTRIRTVPVTVHFLSGRGKHRLDTAIGVLTGSDNSNAFTSLIGVLGYRYQHPEGGFLFRVGFTPFYGLSADAYPDDGFLPSLGVSFGAGF